MGSGARWFRPRLRGQAVGHRGVEQMVPGGVEVHLVDPLPLWRVRVQNGGIAVCLVPPDLRLGTASERAEGFELVQILLPAPTRDPLAQGWVSQDDVVLRKRRDLVGYLVSAHLREAMRETGPAAVVWCRRFSAVWCSQLDFSDPSQAAGWTPLPRIR